MYKCAVTNTHFLIKNESGKISYLQRFTKSTWRMHLALINNASKRNKHVFRLNYAISFLSKENSSFQHRHINLYVFK